MASRASALVLSTLLALVACAPAHAQWKPAKPVTIIVPWAAGGSTDQVTRVAAAEIEKQLGQKVVIVNQPGASGSIGTKSALEAPKDGYLHVIDLAGDTELYRQPVTRVFNADAPITPEGTRFCPGSQAGAEWNSPAYDPAANLVFTGEVDWCSTVRAAAKDDMAKAPTGLPWSGSPDGFGKQDDPTQWAGWMTATDADSGKRKWQFKAPFPLMGGITPTAGGALFFGDMGGTFYAFDAKRGIRLWSSDLGGAIAGGVISYDNSVKRDVLDVPEEVLATKGAVSSECAAAMADGARRLLKTDLAVSLTGIAGPGGGSAEKPVGLVWFGLSSARGTITEKMVFPGDREAVRASAVEHALQFLLKAAE
jgi:PncC family amidohydrolase